MKESEIYQYLRTAAICANASDFVDLTEDEKSKFKQTYGPAVAILGRFVVYELSEAAGIISEFEHARSELILLRALHNELQRKFAFLKVTADKLDSDLAFEIQRCP